MSYSLLTKVTILGTEFELESGPVAPYRIEQFLDTPVTVDFSDANGEKIQAYFPLPATDFQFDTNTSIFNALIDTEKQELQVGLEVKVGNNYFLNRMSDVLSITDLYLMLSYNKNT